MQRLLCFAMFCLSVPVVVEEGNSLPVTGLVGLSLGQREAVDSI